MHWPGPFQDSCDQSTKFFLWIEKYVIDDFRRGANMNYGQGAQGPLVNSDFS